jgi:hypothetical protein
MPEHYQIRVREHIDLSWSAWFDGLTIVHDSDGCTTLTGHVVDQAALHGTLARIRDLRLTLISVIGVEQEGNASQRRRRRRDTQKGNGQ